MPCSEHSSRIVTRLIVVLILITGLTGCSSASPEVEGTPVTITEVPAETQASTPEVTETTAPSEEPVDPPRSVPTQYQIEARLDYLAKAVSVVEVIRYTNSTGEALSELVFAVEANRYSRVFSLESLTAGGEALAEYELEKNRLAARLSTSLQPGENLEIELRFQLELPEIPEPGDDRRPELFGYTERQVNLVDWYPYLPPYLAGEGWLLHDAWYYGEHQVYESADYVVDLTLVNAPDTLVVAASAPAQSEGTHLRYELKGARNFSLSASPEYRVFNGEQGGTAIAVYTFPFEGNTGADILRHAQQALDLYTRLYGPYPHDSLAIVEADFLDGMEFSGLFFLSKGFFNIYDGSPGSYLISITVHETAHQWWYETVGNDQALEPWLDEALCTYSEYLYLAEYHPEAIPWWQQVRVDFYQPEGPVDGSIYDYSGYIPYRNGVYLRGAKFLADLRERVGDDAFFGTLSDLVQHYGQADLLTSDAFFNTLAERSTADIQDLVAEYFTAQP